jgi:hypothetical protein
METTICLYNKGNESSLDACFCVGLCVLLNDNYCYMHCHRQSTLYQICMSWIDNDNIHQGLKTSLVMIISIRLYVWQGKRWGTSFCTWAPLSDTTNTITSQNVSWATMHSLSHMQCNKWIPKSLMIWPHLYHERCATIRCDIWKQICNVVKRWAKDKQNEKVLKQVNNQTPTTRPTQEWRRVHTTSKKMSIRSKANSYSYSWSIKEYYIWRYDYTTRLSKSKTCDQTTLGNITHVSYNAT